MTPDPDRLALLSAIAAAPADDVPRLVYADWLDEHGTADADRARAEYIRVSCRMVAKGRISRAEGDWLDANWDRLWPALTHADGPASGVETVRRAGRWFVIQGHLAYDDAGRMGGPFRLRMECWRGVVRVFEHNSSAAVCVGTVVAADEPLAGHRYTSAFPISTDGRILVYSGYALPPPVYERLVGYTDLFPAAKAFDPDPGEPFDAFNRRVGERVADAITAYARRAAGWPESF